ncbi:MAG TPA: sugar phosphate nucleotidyltransferase [Dissulfurispiraceae bacterium]|nr:sugar phosphate nucleotidyltransferase [Dissulfurispiraceae bacterium]
MNSDLNCFILAAGLGERLRPITNHIPKPLLPILGKPLLQAIIERMMFLPINKIGINVHHKRELVESWMQRSSFAERIVIFPEVKILDTGGALKNASAMLSRGDFLVHNGDIISDVDLMSMLEHHRKSNSTVTLAVHDHPKFNNVAVGADGEFRGVGRGSGRHVDHYVAFTGIAIYAPAFLDYLPSGASSVVDAWQKAAAAGCRLDLYDVSGCYWSDIGSPSSYAAAIMDGLRKAGENIYVDPAAVGCGDAILESNISIEGNAGIGERSMLRNCIILPEGLTQQNKRYENCIVGPDFVITVEESAFIQLSEKGVHIGTGGSDRQYYRSRSKAVTIVSMECSPEDPDFARHVEYTGFFRKYGIPVPEMLSVDYGRKAATFEDLGDLSLYSWLKCPRSDSEVEHIYQRVIDILVLLHCLASDHVAECPLLEARIFDYDYLRWETNYFLERFVYGLKHAHPGDSVSIECELHQLASKTDSYAKRIIHRDFQSQNILISKGNMPRVIDYQGARIAPPAYDVASILWDPYAPLNPDVRKNILEYYIAETKKNAVGWFDSDNFNDSLLYCRLQRHMQALGAYGYLSVIKGKDYFLKHIPECLRLLTEELSLSREEFPALYDLVIKL